MWKTPLFLRSFDVILVHHQQQILSHLMLCLLFPWSEPKIYVHWTGPKQPNDDHDDDDDDDIIHQTVSHTIKNILLLTYQWFRRVTFHAIYRKWLLLCVVKLLPFQFRCWKCIVNSLVYLMALPILFLLLFWFIAFFGNKNNHNINTRSNGIRAFHSIKFWLAKS